MKGVNGVVAKVGLGETKLSTEDGEQITISGKYIVWETLINSYANKVVEMTVGISYDDASQRAIEAIQAALTKIPEFVAEPAPQIGI